MEGVQRFLGGGVALQRGAGHHVLQHLGGGGVPHHTNGLALQRGGGSIDGGVAGHQQTGATDAEGKAVGDLRDSPPGEGYAAGNVGFAVITAPMPSFTDLATR